MNAKDFSFSAFKTKEDKKLKGNEVVAGLVISNAPVVIANLSKQ